MAEADPDTIPLADVRHVASPTRPARARRRHRRHASFRPASRLAPDQIRRPRPDRRPLLAARCWRSGLAWAAAGLTNGWPLWRDDHPLYYHSALVTRRS